MGEVYRVRDSKLDRDVVLKILPEAFAADPDRLAGASWGAGDTIIFAHSQAGLWRGPAGGGEPEV